MNRHAFVGIFVFWSVLTPYAPSRIRRRHRASRGRSYPSSVTVVAFECLRAENGGRKNSPSRRTA